LAEAIVQVESRSPIRGSLVNLPRRRAGHTDYRARSAAAFIAVHINANKKVTPR
jgi:hypothetical protein